MSDSKFMDGVFINKKEFANGGHIIKMDINPDRLIAWLQQAPRTDKGYIKTQIQSKREPELDQYGNVKMFCALDSYFYPELAAPAQANPQSYTPPSSQAPAQQGFDDEKDINNDELPF